MVNKSVVVCRYDKYYKHDSITGQWISILVVGNTYQEKHSAHLADYG